MKFYVCKHCGNIITFEENKGVPVICCGEKMSELVPGSVDAAAEKHVPVISVEGNKVTVTVGEVAHPMLEEHFIKWIVLETAQGSQRKELKAGEQPQAVFMLTDCDKPVAAYAYCNLHGLWSANALIPFHRTNRRKKISSGGFLLTLLPFFCIMRKAFYRLENFA